MVTAHSGALAGEHGAYEAVFDAYGVHEVLTLDEMADAMELFSSPRRVRGTGRGIASVHDSGGERALVRRPGQRPRRAVRRDHRADARGDRRHAGPGAWRRRTRSTPGAPGIDADRIFRESFLVMHEDPDTAALAFVVDLTRQGEPYDEGYLQVAKDVFEATTKPFCIVSNLASAVALEEAAYLRDRGHPRARRHAVGVGGAAGADRPARYAVTGRRWKHPRRWPRTFATGGGNASARARRSSELEGLRAAGRLRHPRDPHPGGRVGGRGGRGAANELGWPVAIKTAAPGVQHKSDVGGVALGLADADALRTAYEDIAARLGPRVVVAPMAPKGVEVALGIVRDPTFGPLVLVAAGGVLVELMNDRQLALPPLDEHRAPGAHRSAADLGRCWTAFVARPPPMSHSLRVRDLTALGPGRRPRRPDRRARREPDDRLARRVRGRRRPGDRRRALTYEGMASGSTLRSVRSRRRSRAARINPPITMPMLRYCAPVSPATVSS